MAEVTDAADGPLLHSTEGSYLERRENGSRECSKFVNPAARQASLDTSASAQPSAEGVPTPVRGFGDEQVDRRSGCSALLSEWHGHP
jgi:hypothetical protein